MTRDAMERLDQQTAANLVPAIGPRDDTIQLQNAILLLQVATRILERAGFLKTCCSSMQGGMNRKNPGNRTRHLFLQGKNTPAPRCFRLAMRLDTQRGRF